MISWLLLLAAVLIIMLPVEKWRTAYTDTKCRSDKRLCLYKLPLPYCDHTWRVRAYSTEYCVERIMPPSNELAHLLTRCYTKKPWY